MAKVMKIKWLQEPAEKDYEAAASYLSLVADEATVKKIVANLRKAPMSGAKAKDIMRASRLPLLPPSDVLVARDMAKARAGKPLSPVLLVRGDAARGLPLQIADGYHRVCANYHFGDDSEIPCHVVGLEGK
ncbi:MAG TPA: hypothetical protein VF808_06410 [Ktedonobacterales bacterium]